MLIFKNFTRVATIVVAFALLNAAGVALAEEPPVFTGRGDYAIRGYDTVAYHLEKKPVKGDNEFVVTFDWFLFQVIRNRVVSSYCIVTPASKNRWLLRKCDTCSI